MKNTLQDRIARLYIAGDKPTLSRREALNRVAAIAASKAFQRDGIAGLKGSTRETLETLLAFVGSPK